MSTKKARSPRTKSVDSLTKLDQLSSPFPQRDKINFPLDIDCRFELTEKQKEFINLIHDKKTKIVLCKGPAGTSKTYLAIYAALRQ